MGPAARRRGQWFIHRDPALELHLSGLGETNCFRWIKKSPNSSMSKGAAQSGRNCEANGPAKPIATPKGCPSGVGPQSHFCPSSSPFLYSSQSVCVHPDQDSRLPFKGQLFVVSSRKFKGCFLGLPGAGVGSLAISTSGCLTESCVPLTLCSRPHGCCEDHFIREMETITLVARTNRAHGTQTLDGACFFSTVHSAAFPWTLRLHVPSR